MAISIVLNVVAIARVRIWNPRQELAPRAEEEPPREPVAAGREAEAPMNRSVATIHGAGGKTRGGLGQPDIVAGNPNVGLRQTCRCHPHRLLGDVLNMRRGGRHSQRPAAVGSGEAIPAAAKPLAALLVVGLILLNALAVTSLTNERDSQGLGPAAGNRSFTQGNRIRQTGRCVLQRQRNDPAAGRALRIFVVR